jgi:hypothetical protein
MFALLPEELELQRLAEIMPVRFWLKSRQLLKDAIKVSGSIPKSASGLKRWVA